MFNFREIRPFSFVFLSQAGSQTQHYSLNIFTSHAASVSLSFPKRSRHSEPAKTDGGDSTQTERFEEVVFIKWQSSPIKRESMACLGLWRGKRKLEIIRCIVFCLWMLLSSAGLRELTFKYYHAAKEVTKSSPLVSNEYIKITFGSRYGKVMLTRWAYSSTGMCFSGMASLNSPPPHPAMHTGMSLKPSSATLTRKK